jgi:hypothetical protein
MFARELPKRPCKECGIEFRPAGLKRTFCSRLCLDRYYKREARKNQSYYYPTLFSLLTPMILERDANRCIACGVEQKIIQSRNGKSRSNIEVHHIDKDQTNNEPSNLVTLCKRCHSAAHHLKPTLFQWLQGYARTRSQCMTSKLKKRITTLLETYSHTTA